jgi:hypothetical protein
MNDPREELLVKGMLERSTKNVAGLKLRAFTVGTTDLCKAFGLTMFLDPETVKGIEKTGLAPMAADELERQLITFAWMQSEELDVVLESLDADTWKNAVRKFKFNVDLGAITPLLQEIARVSGLSVADSVEVAKKPSDSSEKDAPPNS